MTTILLNHALVRLRNIGATFAILGLFQASLWAQNPTSSFVAPTAPYREDRILIMPKTGKTSALASMHAQNQVAVLAEFPGIGGLQTLRVPEGETVPTLIAKRDGSSYVFDIYLQGDKETIFFDV